MSRCSLSFVVALFVLSSSLACADEAKELKIITSVKETSRERGIGPIKLKRDVPIVIRSAEELVAASNDAASAKDEKVQKAMEGALAKILKVDAIDWKKQMVLIGIVESIDSAKLDGKVLNVTFVRYVERPTRAVLPSPKVVALTERFEGEVKFVAKEIKKTEKE